VTCLNIPNDLIEDESVQANYPIGKIAFENFLNLKNDYFDIKNSE
jgi:hypothetical protein